MEFLYEAFVLAYLTRGGNRFCTPQYGIKTEDGKEDWRCPDFVALDFEKRQIILAEVTSAWNIGTMAKKVVEMQNQGVPKLRQQMADKIQAAIPELSKWETKIQLFVREDRKPDLEKQLEGKLDKKAFEIITLEETFRRWKWDVA